MSIFTKLAATVSRVITPIEDRIFGIRIEHLGNRFPALQPLDEDAAFEAWQNEARAEHEVEVELHGERYTAWAESYRERGMKPPAYEQEWCPKGCQALYGTDCGICGFDGFGCYEWETRNVADLGEDGRYHLMPRKEIEADWFDDQPVLCTYDPKRDARYAWKATYRAERLTRSGRRDDFGVEPAHMLNCLLLAGVIRRDVRAEARASRTSYELSRIHDRLQQAIEQETDGYARAVMRGAVDPDLTLI